MSKAISDLVDRIVGVAAALKGVKSKLAVPPPEQPPVETNTDDLEQAKKLTEELKGLAATLEAEVAKEAKVPDAAQTASGDTKSKTK